MPILNYTTQIDAEKTVTEIQKKLANGGFKQLAHAPPENKEP
jgi:hypothetical protein